MRVLRYGSAIFVAGAGNREVARYDGGDISWQAQYFVRVRRVDAERFVAGAGSREVVSCGIEVNVAVTLGLACERGSFGGAGIAKLLGRAVPRWVFPLDFWRKSRTKRRLAASKHDFWRKSRTKRSRDCF